MQATHRPQTATHRPSHLKYTCPKRLVLGVACGHLQIQNQCLARGARVNNRIDPTTGGTVADVHLAVVVSAHSIAELRGFGIDQ